MLVIPAIDLKDGRCVRLRQGRFDDVTVFSDDPLAVAQRWFDAGCRRLHLVDLDGAVAGAPRNDALVRRICEAAGAVPIQVGGGIRDQATIAAYLDAGISQVILGTRAVADPEFLADACSTYPDRIILGLDARDGLLATDGWEATSTLRAVDFAREAAAHPLYAMVYTDIARDGMLSGLNVAATEQYPKGLGATAPILAERLGEIPAKLMFSCRECSEIFTEFANAGRRKVLVVGIESHVCVQQSVLDLMGEGFRIYVAVDAVGSRHQIDYQTALRRMDSAGATLTTTEAALFEWCEVAGTAEFKQISQLVREEPPEPE